MSQYLNDQQYTEARQALIDAGYSESGADTELEKHQEKYRSTTDSLVKHFNDSSAQRLAVEGLGTALATYGAVEATKGIYNRMFKPSTPSNAQRVEPALEIDKPLANKVGSEPVLFGEETFTPEKIPTADQATKEMVEAGTIKRGKAYGSTDVLDQAILKSEPLIEVEKKLEAANAVKGAAVPSRRTPKEAVVFKEETPFNKAYNQYSQKLGGMNAPTESPLQKQFDTAWEDIHKNVLKGEMPKSQGGNPVGWDEAEKLVRSQPEKYPDIIKHLDQAAEKYGKSYTSEKGFASLSGMANLAGNALGALGLTQAYKQAKKTGDWSDFGLGAINQVVGNIAPRAAVPLALMTPSAVSSGTLDSPEARELFARAQAKQVGAGRGIAPPSAYMR